MPEQLFDRVLVPVANRDDAASTGTALVPYAAGRDATVTSVHVIEKAGGALDKASVEQRERKAKELLSIITHRFADVEVTLETDVRYGTDVAAAIIDAAHDTDASAIAFTPRGGNRWQNLLTGDVTDKLVENSDVPVLVLPDRGASDA